MNVRQRPYGSDPDTAAAPGPAPLPRSLPV